MALSARQMLVQSAINNSGAIARSRFVATKLPAEHGFGGRFHLPHVKKGRQLRAVEAGDVDGDEAFLERYVGRNGVWREGRIVFAAVENNVGIIDSSYLSRGGDRVVEVSDLIDQVQFLCLP